MWVSGSYDICYVLLVYVGNVSNGALVLIFPVGVEITMVREAEENIVLIGNTSLITRV